jgi:hypothetical protein
MFEKKKKNGLDNRGPKNTTFGNDSDNEQELEDVPNVDDLMAKMDGAISSAKNREKNASIAKVYSSSGQSQKTESTVKFNGCGCFGKH